VAPAGGRHGQARLAPDLDALFAEHERQRRDDDNRHWTGIEAMNKGKEILQVAEVVSNEKGLDKEIIFEAIEAALASAAKRRSMEEIDVRVAIDRKTGDYEAFRRWEVLPDEDTEELEFEADRARFA
jgi:hypothetical protein